tara:strand:- start:418 stop:756 length:339 start_codon:yes stop_codon:yes gene_type:complete
MAAQAGVESDLVMRAQGFCGSGCGSGFEFEVLLGVSLGFGALAQLGEHLLCKQGVIGSIPISSTIFVDLADLSCSLRRSGVPNWFGGLVQLTHTLSLQEKHKLHMASVVCLF